MQCTGNRQFNKNFTVQHLHINVFGYVHLLSLTYTLPKPDHNGNVGENRIIYLCMYFYLKQENFANKPDYQIYLQGNQINKTWTTAIFAVAVLKAS